MKSIELQLCEEIESSVERIVAASHAAAVAAIDRGFGRAGASVGRVVASRPNGSTTPRRTPEQIAELAQRLVDAARAEPGQTMAVLAPKLGVPPAQLQVPIARLKKAGQIKTAGTRQFMRYFPVGDDE